MVNLKQVVFIFVSLLFVIKGYGQTVTGFVSRKPVATAENCGCTTCNDATYAASVNYPDPNGACGTTEPSAGTGNCSTTSRSRIIVIPAGCTVTINGGVGDRPGCSGTNPGAGLDGGDQFSIVGSLGTINCNSGVQTASGNASVFVGPLTQVGGQVSFNLTANRIAELLTYTIVYSAVGCTPSPLPLQLLSFTADKDKDAINLKWSTASEKNVLGFDIEYSFDALNFDKQLTVGAAGNIYDVNHYSQILPNIYNDENIYFRLKLKNKDDSFSYSPILSLNDANNDNFILMPNPTSTGDIIIRSKKTQNTNTVLRVLNSTGQEVYDTILKIPDDYVDLKVFGKGLYFFYLVNSEKTTFKKIVYH